MSKTIEEIRKILLAHWDPLGAGQNPSLASEYDAYIPRISELLSGRAALEKIQDYLAGLDKEWGGDPDLKAARLTAQKLLENV